MTQVNWKKPIEVVLHPHRPQRKVMTARVLGEILYGEGVVAVAVAAVATPGHENIFLARDDGTVIDANRFNHLVRNTLRPLGVTPENAEDRIESIADKIYGEKWTHTYNEVKKHLEDLIYGES